MALYSTSDWRAQFRNFLSRRDWTYVRWTQELNHQPVLDNRYLHLTEFTITRWLNNTASQREYRGPKTREDYVGLAHALLRLEIINQREARHWLRVQGLYPLPQEAALFGQGAGDDS